MQRRTVGYQTELLRLADLWADGEKGRNTDSLVGKVEISALTERTPYSVGGRKWPVSC
jgi:hypothetical protein